MPKINGTPKPCGVTFSEPTGRIAYLPLERLDVHAEIVDVSATVTLTQTFWQGWPAAATPCAKYVFPVPAQAAVCGFEMRTEDGRVIKAVAKEKETARKEHEQAIKQGRMTGLVEHVTDDVFTVSLGCLPQFQMITTKLTYVMDLLEDDFMDQVRFQLPVSVGMRYGQTPSKMVVAKAVSGNRINISVDVFMKGGIQNLTSPTHPTFELSSDGTVSTPANITRNRGWYHSPSFLSQDFVLSIKSEGLDAPRCFAERGPTGTVAMQLTVVPQFKFPSIPAQEYMFLVDRSGSMEGSRIETAKRGLVMLLRSLPTKGTAFNILSFGSTSSSLWETSQNYTEATLVDATKHVDSMSANYGGTGIRTALQYMFNGRRRDIPTSCFVLTDGEAWDVDAVIATVTNAASEAKAEAPLRVFTLGIGETTSSALCNGIARAGQGICLMAATSEAIIAKCSKLVKASRSHILNNVTVDWHIPSLDATTRPLGDQSVVFRQGPRSLPPLYAGTRFVSFAIVDHEQFEIPQEVVVQATRVSTGELYKFAVPVEVLETATPVSNSGMQRPLIHTLAARRIIMDLEDREKGDISTGVKTTIIHLGEQYQLASRFTSFIAVEDHDKEKLGPIPSYSSENLDEEDLLVGGGVFMDGGGASVGAPGLGITQCAPARSRFLRSADTDDESSEESDDECGFLIVDEDYDYRPAPATSVSLGASPPLTMAAYSSTTASVPIPTAQPGDNVERLVRLQSFDGSFSVSDELAQILGREVLAQAQSRGADEKTWATVLALVYLRKHLQDQPELLEGLEEKATDYIQEAYGDDFGALLQAAEALMT
ncbi:hypothetical protein EIP86_008530 [Pleurotus ostreatoroseus]|nr:hypothetical protein EIP86_008530 [Pleurotus ostreatoroseus]